MIITWRQKNPRTIELLVILGLTTLGDHIANYHSADNKVDLQGESAKMINLDQHQAIWMNRHHQSRVKWK